MEAKKLRSIQSIKAKFKHNNTSNTDQHQINTTTRKNTRNDIKFVKKTKGKNQNQRSNNTRGINNKHNTNQQISLPRKQKQHRTRQLPYPAKKKNEKPNYKKDQKNQMKTK